MSVDVSRVSPQPYFASVLRAAERLRQLGHPMVGADHVRLLVLAERGHHGDVADSESLLAPYTLAKLHVHADGHVESSAGGARRDLIEHGWKGFLLRIENPHAVEEDLEVLAGFRAWGTRQLLVDQRPGLRDTVNPAQEVERLWLQAQLEGNRRLNGFDLEYRVVELCSRDRGDHTARLSFGAGGKAYPLSQTAWDFVSCQGLELEFKCAPSRDMTVRVADSDGQSCVAALTIKDLHGHVYPSQVLRLAPDMFFQAHVYRADGEVVALPEGTYTVEYWRGPEYLRKVSEVRVGKPPAEVHLHLERWIDPSQWGWYPGDVHIHAAGCSHYMQPTQGVRPETMIRHVRGEALAVGQVLTWGPAWYYQKQFFSGRAISPAATLEHSDLQTANNVRWKPQATDKDAESLLRYDVEVSGFPSSMCGHLILLRLKTQEFPKTRLIEDWPSWNLPILHWAIKQGGVVGYAHCGLGMGTSDDTLPNYEIPPFDSAGVNEGIVDVTHDALHFIAGCELNPAYELNAWYHMLNCGFTPVFAGETDYPCLYDERPGVGRSYVRLGSRPLGDAGYEKWVTSFRDGRLYAGDGRSHLLEFSVNDVIPGDSPVTLAEPSMLRIRAVVAARLEAQVTPETEAIRGLPRYSRPTWHLERARIGDSRQVKLELVVNGQVAQAVGIIADGTPHEVRLETHLVRSSWMALRIMPSSHSYPVFVSVGGKPIRASRRSAEWLRTSVDQLWKEKHRFIRESERNAAGVAYEHARRTYDAIIMESDIP
jgi:N-methylcarbamate hydrolase